jgi:hypothetical protein
MSQSPIDAFAALIEKTIPVLQKHPKAWRQLSALLLVGAIAAGIFSISTKFDPNKALETLHPPSGMKRPQDDCTVKADSFTCE